MNTPQMNRITSLFKIQYPIIQAGMVWCSGWRLASAVSNAGGLGIIGAGSMYPHVLEEHLQKMNEACFKPYAVNLPLLYPDIDKHINNIIKYKVPIVFTSAGNPKTWTARLKDHGITVVHVVSNTKFAIKAEEAGVDAVVAEGFEAGGHNGREETTTMVLIPLVREATNLPLIAAGGIGSGASMLAAFALGAEAVQCGTLFAAALESSAHPVFKEQIVAAKEGATELVMKETIPVRLLKNPFYQQIKQAELAGASKEELLAILGRGRAKLGMFEGNMEEGELEIGQVAANVHASLPASQILTQLWQDFLLEKEKLCQLNF